MDEKAYEEAGRAHRYFLSWRHAAFAGYFVILYGVATLIEKVWEKPEALAAVLLLSGLIGPALFFIDVRTRQLYNAAVQAGRAAESDDKPKLFERLDEPPKWWPSNFPGPHSFAIWFVYWLFSLFLLITGAAVAWSRFCR